MATLTAQDRIDDWHRQADADRLVALARTKPAPAVTFRERIRRTAQRMRLITRGAAA